MDIVIDQFFQFLNALDWVYIFSFMLITYAIQYYRIPVYIGNGLGIRIRKRYQVLLIGFLYGSITFFVRGYQEIQLLWLFISFLFAVTTYKFLFQIIVERFLPTKKTNHSSTDEL